MSSGTGSLYFEPTTSAPTDVVTARCGSSLAEALRHADQQAPMLRLLCDIESGRLQDRFGSATPRRHQRDLTLRRQVTPNFVGLQSAALPTARIRPSPAIGRRQLLRIASGRGDVRHAHREVRSSASRNQTLRASVDVPEVSACPCRLTGAHAARSSFDVSRPRDDWPTRLHNTRGDQTPWGVAPDRAAPGRGGYPSSLEDARRTLKH